MHLQRYVWTVYIFIYNCRPREKSLMLSFWMSNGLAQWFMRVFWPFCLHVSDLVPLSRGNCSSPLILTKKSVNCILQRFQEWLRLRFLYNRLALIMCYLLDIDLALFSLLLLWEVKSNKSWNTFFAIKVLFYVHDIIQPFATFQYQLH